MNEQIWGPDTCGCKVVEIYEREPYRVVSTRVERKCQDHSDVPDDDLYGVLFANHDGENKRKNQVEAILLGQRELKNLNLHEQKFDKNGSPAGIGWKKGLKYKWSFSGVGKDRVLHVEVDGASIPENDKKALKDNFDNKFGTNKVVIF